MNKPAAVIFFLGGAGLCLNRVGLDETFWLLVRPLR